MTNLTERWKKGELEQGYYYTKYTPKVGKPFVEIELTNYLLDLAKVRDANTVEVLAPVPSYLQWNAMLESNDSLVQTINALKNRLVEVAEENVKLKETIKRTKANGNYPSRVSAYKSRIAILCEENQKLKDLLKECRKEYTGDKEYTDTDIVYMIDEALK